MAIQFSVDEISVAVKEDSILMITRSTSGGYYVYLSGGQKVWLPRDLGQAVLDEFNLEGTILVIK